MLDVLAEATTSVTSVFLDRGVLGAVIIVLGSVVVYKERQVIKKDERISELQDLRLEDTKEVSRQVTSVLQANTQSNLILAEKIEIAKGSGRSK